ncbi:hypothetical protein ACQ4PT_054008 [Festuca glaucescens]
MGSLKISLMSEFIAAYGSAVSLGASSHKGASICNADLGRELQATKIVSEKPPKFVDPKVQIQEKREEFYDLMKRHGDPWEKIDILPQLAVYIKPRPDDWMWRILRNVKYVKLCFAHVGFLFVGMTTALLGERAKKEDSDPGGGQKLEIAGPSPLPGTCIASPQIMDV